MFANLGKAAASKMPLNMEKYDQGHGCILYRTTIPAGEAGTIDLGSVHDFGFVFLDGKQLGITDRRTSSFKIKIPARTQSATLDVLVEAMGRVNFGEEVHDRKGIRGPVKLDGNELSDWKVFSFPLDKKMLGRLHFQKSAAAGPAFWRGSIQVAKPADTFLDLRSWGKGVVWINGHCLGRYWNIGPSQTAYVPGPWLKKGKNEIVILDLLGPEKPVVAGLEQPILNELHPEKDFARSHRPVVTLTLDSVKPVLTASFEPGTALQEVRLDAPAKGRYFCIESLNAFDGKPYAAIGELAVLDRSGKPISHDGWSVAYVDSEEREKEDGTAENAIDGQTANYWHTQWGSAQPNHPHRFVIDFGKSQTVSGFRYVPRQGSGDVGGRIKDYRIYVGDNLVQR
jgi:beta-galactosidase